ncbi:penicillin-binding protein activator, partial [Oleiphilus sp. HI0067]
YALSPRLALLREIPNSFVQGRTGKLAIDDDGSIIRRLQWAKYQGGKAIPIN